MNDMIYRVGDKVRIKPLEEFKKCGAYISTLEIYADTIMTIEYTEYVENKYYCKMEEDERKWWFTLDMIEGLAETEKTKTKTKTKFNFSDYQNPKYVMHCKTIKEAKEFCKLMHEDGRTWRSRKPYIEDTCWDRSKTKTCYLFNLGEYSSRKFYEEDGFLVLEWSDFSDTTASKIQTNTTQNLQQNDTTQNIQTTIKKENNKMTNINDMVKTDVNGGTLIKGKNDGYYKILSNGTLARELYVFDNIAPIQEVNVQTLTKYDIILHEDGIWYVSDVNETNLTITSFATLTSVNMAILQADGLDTGFTKLVNPITFQIENLKVKARDLLATVPSNVPKLQVAVEFTNSDNMEKMVTAMMELVNSFTK